MAKGLSIPIGYVNRNRQKIIQVMKSPGIDLQQSLYRLQCQVCGYTYQVKGDYVRQCECPQCQEGL